MSLMYRLLGALLEPDRLLILAVAAGLGWLWWRQREWRRRLLIVVVPFSLLFVASLPVTAHLGERILQGGYGHLSARPENADCIVVLAGCALPRNAANPKPLLCSDTIYRCLQAAELYRSAEPCTVIASGGAVDAELDMPRLSHQMRDFLVQLGVAPNDISVEDKSTTTHENAIETARLLAQRGTKRVVLVTDAGHMWRAERSFRRAGLDVIPAPCRLNNGPLELKPGDFFPTALAAASVRSTCHELLGLMWYKLKGRI
jgi:uncharacterized SAM-binding protein YcdF (DUF218 family)